MIVVDNEMLEGFSVKHNQAREPLQEWLKTTSDANWRHLMDVRRNYPSADGKVKAQRYTIFNIKGNSFRLITLINYKSQVVEVVDILTHAEYNRWNKT